MIVRNFRAAVDDENNRGPLQTRKDTRQILEPLYNRPSGIQALEIDTWNNRNEFPTMIQW
jgi:hypothetical protein